MHMLMCMCMMNKRTQILLSQDLWENLSELAKERGTSVGNLVREAVQKTYFTEVKNQRAVKAIDKIFAIRPHFMGRIDYEELINYGRKF